MKTLILLTLSLLSFKTLAGKEYCSHQYLIESGTYEKFGKALYTEFKTQFIKKAEAYVKAENNKHRKNKQFKKLQITGNAQSNYKVHTFVDSAMFVDMAHEIPFRDEYGRNNSLLFLAKTHNYWYGPGMTNELIYTRELVSRYHRRPNQLEVRCHLWANYDYRIVDKNKYDNYVLDPRNEDINEITVANGGRVFEKYYKRIIDLSQLSSK